MKLKAMYVLCAIVLYGCAKELSDDEKVQMNVLSSVCRELACRPEGAEATFLVEALNGGFAVIVNFHKKGEYRENPPDYAYWVIDDHVYSVNEAAKECSPNVPPAPEDITYELVLKTVGESEERDERKEE